MDETVLRESVEIERLASEVAEQTLVEGEVALPGGIREEATVLGCEARLVISSVEPQTDRLAMDGTVVFQVLYRQGDETVRVLEANCSFNHMADMAGVTAQMRPQVVGSIQSATAQPVSGRMRLRGVVDVAARVFSPEQLEVVTGVTGVEGLQTLEQTYALTRHAASGHASALLREEFDLNSQLGVHETLYARATPHVRSVSGGSGRANIEGDVTLEVYHAGAEADVPLVVTQHLFPFEQAVDLQGDAGDDMRARVQVQDVVASSVDTGDGMRVLRTETVLDLEVESFTDVTVESLRDAYTLSGETFTLVAESISCFAGVDSISAMESDKLVMHLPEGAPPISRVLGALLTPTMAGHDQVGGRTVVEGILDAQVMYMPANGEAMTTVRQEIPFRIAFQGALPAGAAVRLVTEDVQAEGIASDRVELKYRMGLEADAVKARPISLPVGVHRDLSVPERSGLVMVWPQQGETLWDIAKRQRVTTESIARLNPGMEEARAGRGVLVLKRGCNCGD
ncbi:MAG: LysM peptidoglycan-binding domain-containing protein [Firmicutes bacterium]|nr:LysM peptidoglycan-binding domain-containing protein [Bacillota bacterium]